MSVIARSLREPGRRLTITPPGPDRVAWGFRWARDGDSEGVLAAW